MAKQPNFEAIFEGHRYAPVACTWIHEEWGAGSGRTYEETFGRLYSRNACPATHLVSIGETPVGLVGFHRHPAFDKGTQELWIDALYVIPDYRGRGIGSELVRLGERLAADHESRLYVYTEKVQFYKRLGWTVLRTRNNEGYWVLERVVPDTSLAKAGASAAEPNPCNTRKFRVNRVV